MSSLQQKAQDDEETVRSLQREVICHKNFQEVLTLRCDLLEAELDETLRVFVGAKSRVENKLVAALHDITKVVAARTTDAGMETKCKSLEVEIGQARREALQLVEELCAARVVLEGELTEAGAAWKVREDQIAHLVLAVEAETQRADQLCRDLTVEEVSDPCTSRAESLSSVLNLIATHPE